MQIFRYSWLVMNCTMSFYVLDIDRQNRARNVLKRGKRFIARYMAFTHKQVVCRITQLDILWREMQDKKRETFKPVVCVKSNLGHLSANIDAYRCKWNFYEV